jgi:hypothetical protein
MLERPYALAARRRRSIDALVRHVAESSVEAVCQLVIDRVQEMPLCEARGYVRARASREIRRQARQAFANHPGVDPAWEPLVVLRATERVAPLALRRILADRSNVRRAA